MSERITIPLLVVAGFVLRWWYARDLALNPDDALHYLIAKSENWFHESLPDQHPPLYYGLLHLVQRVSDSETALRLISMISGSLMPWVMYCWLKFRGETQGALLAFLVLQYSPNLVSQSTQLRGYPLMMLLVALTLYWLEKAYRSARVRDLWLSGGFLYAALLTEHSAGFAAAGIGLFGLLRLPEMTARFRWNWFALQAGGLAVCIALWVFIIAPQQHGDMSANIRNGYLSGGVPAAGESIWNFAIKSIAKQFAYAASSPESGAILLGLFAAGLVSLWRQKEVARAALWLSPFVVGIGLASLALHPFGRSRHTVVMSLFCLAGASAGYGWLRGMLPRLHPWVAVLVIGVMWVTRVPDQHDWHWPAASRDQLIQSFAKIPQIVPARGKILADRETMHLLRYYVLDHRISFSRHEANPPLTLPGSQISVHSFGWDHRTFETASRNAQLWRQNSAMSPGEPIWVLDSGFDVLPGNLPGLVRLGPGTILVQAAPE